MTGVAIPFMLPPETKAGAAAERRLVRTVVCLVVERDQLTLAKSVVSLDHISSGHFFN